MNIPLSHDSSVMRWEDTTVHFVAILQLYLVAVYYFIDGGGPRAYNGFTAPATCAIVFVLEDTQGKFALGDSCGGAVVEGRSASSFLCATAGNPCNTEITAACICTQPILANVLDASSRCENKSCMIVRWPRHSRAH